MYWYQPKQRRSIGVLLVPFHGVDFISFGHPFLPFFSSCLAIVLVHKNCFYVYNFSSKGYLRCEQEWLRTDGYSARALQLYLMQFQTYLLKHCPSLRQKKLTRVSNEAWLQFFFLPARTWREQNQLSQHYILTLGRVLASSSTRKAEIATQCRTTNRRLREERRALRLSYRRNLYCCRRLPFERNRRIRGSVLVVTSKIVPSVRAVSLKEEYKYQSLPAPLLSCLATTRGYNSWCSFFLSAAVALAWDDIYFRK